MKTLSEFRAESNGESATGTGSQLDRFVGEYLAAATQFRCSGE